jgi:hypothetical protein
MGRSLSPGTYHINSIAFKLYLDIIQLCRPAPMPLILATSLRRAVTSRSIHTSRILATASSNALQSQLSPADLQKVQTDGNKEGLQKTIKGFGRSRIFRDEKGPTYEHRFLKGPGTVAVSLFSLATADKGETDPSRCS